MRWYERIILGLCILWAILTGAITQNSPTWEMYGSPERWHLASIVFAPMFVALTWINLRRWILPLIFSGLRSLFHGERPEVAAAVLVADTVHFSASLPTLRELQDAAPGIEGQTGIIEHR